MRSRWRRSSLSLHGRTEGNASFSPEIFLVAFLTGTGKVTGGSAEPAREDEDLRAGVLATADPEGVFAVGMNANNGARRGRTVKGSITSHPVFLIGSCRPHRPGCRSNCGICMSLNLSFLNNASNAGTSTAGYFGWIAEGLRVQSITAQMNLPERQGNGSTSHFGGYFVG